MTDISIFWGGGGRIAVTVPQPESSTFVAKCNAVSEWISPVFPCLSSVRRPPGESCATGLDGSIPRQPYRERRLGLLPGTVQPCATQSTVPVGIFLQVLLVIILREKVCRGRGDLCHNWVASPLLEQGVEVIASLFRKLLLFVVIVVNGRSVLCADIVPLTVARSGIVRVPEYVEHFLVGCFRLVKHNVDNLCVTSASRAHPPVAGVFCGATCVTDASGVHAICSPEFAFRTPEAS